MPDQCRTVILLLFLLLALGACKKKTLKGPDLGYGYFPTNIGHWVSYEVDSIYHDSALALHDTFHFQIKEVFESSYTDNEGRDARRIVRYKRSDSTKEWKIKDVWYGIRTREHAEKVEENIRYLKMSFPVDENTTWNGNAANTLEEWEYSYEAVHEEATIGAATFDSTVTVEQRNNINLVETQTASESYAKGVGLVHRTLIDLETYVSGEIKRGLEYEVTYLDHGTL